MSKTKDLQYVPPNMTHVFIKLNSTEIIRRVSTGRIEDGKLVCYNENINMSDVKWGHWYDPETGKHSDGFPVDLIPEKLRFKES